MGPMDALISFTFSISFRERWRRVQFEGRRGREASKKEGRKEVRPWAALIRDLFRYSA